MGLNLNLNVGIKFLAASQRGKKSELLLGIRNRGLRAYFPNIASGEIL